MKTQSSKMLDVNYKNLISRADLKYESQVEKSDDGLPVGNGCMGSLVWTTPTSIKFQINRVDVFANNCETNSFNRRDQDYAYGCGYVDIDFSDFDIDVFPEDNTKQCLSVYDGMVKIKGKNVTVEIFCWYKEDVMAIRIKDVRDNPSPITTKLRMLREPKAKTKHHLAESYFRKEKDKITLLQEFKEDEYYCSSALAATVLERETKSRISNEREINLMAEPEEGSFTILLGTDASFDQQIDLFKSTVEKLSKASACEYNELLTDNKEWWHKYWKRSFVHLHSNDNAADRVEKNYTYFLYLMAASSRGAYPPNYGGMIFSTKGDHRKWGAQQWWSNLSIYYRGLYPANRLELFDPLFNEYSGMYESCCLAARQQWGSKGVYFPESTFFDGLAELPEEIAKEMRDLYLFNKPWETMSKQFREYAFSKHPHNSRWQWKSRGRFEKGRWTYSCDEGPASAVLHFFMNTLEIAYLYWKRYEYSLDKEWLRKEAYPVIKGAVEFLRNYPNMKKASDGKYHIYHVNCSEGTEGTTDSIDLLVGLYGVLPVLIQASEILELDAGIRSQWQEFYENLAPLPTSHHPDANDDWGYTPDVEKPPVFVTGLKPTICQKGGLSGHFDNRIRYYDFDLATLESQYDKPEDIEIWRNTFKNRYPDGITDETEIHPMSAIGVIAARLGLTESVRNALIRQLESTPDQFFVEKKEDKRVLDNRLTLCEGYNAIGAQRLGNVTYTLHEALCQSIPPAPGEDPVIRLFPAWPDGWNADFNLLFRRGFLISSSFREGEVEFVEIQSQLGGKCKLRNPWEGNKVDIYYGDRKKEDVSEDLFEFETDPGDKIILVKSGVDPGLVTVEV